MGVFTGGCHQVYYELDCFFNMILQRSNSIILFLFLIAATSFTRGPEAATSHIQKVSDNLYKKVDGWQPPELTRFRIKESRQQSEMLPDKPVKVYETVYEPAGSNQVIMDDPLSTASTPLKLEILQLTLYDWNERTFSYVLQTTPYAPPGGGRVTHISYLTYYDEDGDGSFETLNTRVRGPLHTPNWVLQN